MKRQSMRRIIAGILCLTALAGCSRTNELPGSNSCSQNPPESSDSAFSKPAGAPSSVVTAPSSQSLSGITQKIVYKEGPIGPGSGDYLEIPAGLNEEEMSEFVNCLTIAIKAPLSSVNEMDADTAFRFTRNMISFYCETHPDTCSRTVELVPGSGRVYSIIPMTDFLAFTSTHFGIDDISSFQNSIPAEDRIVVFQPEEGNILLIPSLEYVASDFETGCFTVEDTTMYLQVEAADLGTLTYCFDISNGLENYRLTSVK